MVGLVAIPGALLGMGRDWWLGVRQMQAIRSPVHY